MTQQIADYLNGTMLVDLAVLARLAVALVLGAAVGYEREAAGKAAGLRTHMFVCIGSTLFVSLGALLVLQFRGFGETMNTDPIRLIEAVVAGIGFLGAGTIFVARDRGQVQGLTTAASMWVTAAIGVAVGVERYLLAVGTTVLVLVVLHVFLPLSERISPQTDGRSPED